MRVLSASTFGQRAFIVQLEVVESSKLEVEGSPRAGWDEVAVAVKSTLRQRDIKISGFSVTVVAEFPIGDPRQYGLAIALALAAQRGYPEPTFPALGELSLGGNVYPMRGVLAIIRQLSPAYRTFIVPSASLHECAWAGVDVGVIPIDNLPTVLSRPGGLGQPEMLAARAPDAYNVRPDVDMSYCRFTDETRMALEVAAAGRHSVMLYGPPGVGKTMFARALHSLTRTDPQMLVEAADIHSIAGLSQAQMRRGPFRAPHHTASALAIVGAAVGGSPRPGEVSLAHGGMLFLDELPEFPRRVTEYLHKRTTFQVVKNAMFPSDYQLVASMNPCPCGYYGFHETHRVCKCAMPTVKRYQARVDAMLDRFDMFVTMRPVDTRDKEPKESTDVIRKRLDEIADAGGITEVDLGAFNRQKRVTATLESLQRHPRWSHLTIEDIARHAAEMTNPAFF